MLVNLPHAESGARKLRYFFGLESSKLKSLRSARVPQSAEVRPQDVYAHVSHKPLNVNVNFMTNFSISDRDATFSVRDLHSTGELGDRSSAVDLLQGWSELT